LTQPQGLASLKKSTKIPQESSKTLAFDYEAAEDEADEMMQSPAAQNLLAKIRNNV
jgi:hypothetical protein